MWCNAIDREKVRSSVEGDAAAGLGMRVQRFANRSKVIDAANALPRLKASRNGLELTYKKKLNELVTRESKLIQQQADMKSGYNNLEDDEKQYHARIDQLSRREASLAAAEVQNRECRREAADIMSVAKSQLAEANAAEKIVEGIRDDLLDALFSIANFKTEDLPVVQRLRSVRIDVAQQADLPQTNVRANSQYDDPAF
jgi:myosin heavy subunit